MDLARNLIGRCLTGFGCDFALLFGQTEMSPITTLFRPEHQLSHIGAVGTPLTGVQVAIIGPDGELLPPGETGEIVYRGPSTMSGYLYNEDATAQAFAYGWFHSGDVGLPHQRWGEAVTAFVVPRPGETIDAGELVTALKASLDGFKVPKSVVFVEQLPRTSTGKIQKNVLRSEYAAHYRKEEG
jgi:acyl-CoA synthetase (AMP-forming)/AMP-acid ligase II